MATSRPASPFSVFPRPLPDNVVPFPRPETAGEELLRIVRSIGRALSRGLRQRCPACGEGRLFRSYVVMEEGCASCGARYAREVGQWMGSLLINVIATFLVLAAGFTLVPWSALPFGGHLALWEGVAILFPLAFFRLARGLWMGLVHLSGGVY